MLKFDRMSCYAKILQHRTFFETQPIVEPALFQAMQCVQQTLLEPGSTKDDGPVKVVLSFGATCALLRFLN
jgi:hypothetical protein